MYGQGTAATSYPAEVPKVPLVEEAVGDVQFVINEMSELTQRIRTFADGFLGSRPTGVPTLGHTGIAAQAPPTRGEVLRNTVGNLKNVNKELADEVARLSNI